MIRGGGRRFRDIFNELPGRFEMLKTASSLIYDVIYKLATGEENPLKDAGKADEEGISNSDVRKKELAMGAKVEKEHTDDPATAKEIARDHLTELPDYYTRLEEMEEEGKKELEGGKQRAPSQKEIIDYLASLNSPPDDESFHEHSDKKNWDNHSAEAEAYSLAHREANQIKEGSTMLKSAEQIAYETMEKVALSTNFIQNVARRHGDKLIRDISRRRDLTPGGRFIELLDQGTLPNHPRVAARLYKPYPSKLRTEQQEALRQLKHNPAEVDKAINQLWELPNSERRALIRQSVGDISKHMPRRFPAQGAEFGNNNRTTSLSAIRDMYRLLRP